MRQINVLIADDNEMVCKVLSTVVLKAGYQAFTANNTEQSYQILEENRIDILFQDLCFPEISDGFKVLEHVQENHSYVAVIVISAKVHLSDAMQVFKLGATEFIEKPVIPEYLITKIRNVKDRITKEEKSKNMIISAVGMVGSSEAMQVIHENIILAAQYNSPVLITGETGVGKELVAQAIHKLSSHSNQSMITVNCGAIPRDLVESELFGYEQGAFTGALKSRKGYFEYADGSDILLDEISELPIQAQAKLLRILAEGEIQKLGGKMHKVNCRVICTTNHDLPTQIKNGDFREDLYYRINTINIKVPPLKSRKEDILELAIYFLNLFSLKNNILPKTISSQAMQWLIEHDWKGNVRELRNTIERGVIFAKNDSLTVLDLHPSEKTINTSLSTDSNSLRSVVHAFEKGYIFNTLIEHDWNITHSAKALGLDKSNLLKKIKHYKINHPT